MNSGRNDLSDAPVYRSFPGSGEVQVSIDGRLPSDSSDGEATIEVDFGSPGLKLKTESGAEATISGTMRVNVSAQAIESGGPVGGGCGA